MVARIRFEAYNLKKKEMEFGLIKEIKRFDKTSKTTGKVSSRYFVMVRFPAGNSGSAIVNKDIAEHLVAESKKDAPEHHVHIVRGVAKARKSKKSVKKASPKKASLKELFPGLNLGLPAKKPRAKKPTSSSGKPKRVAKAKVPYCDSYAARYRARCDSVIGNDAECSKVAASRKAYCDSAKAAGKKIRVGTVPSCNQNAKSAFNRAQKKGKSVAESNAAFQRAQLRCRKALLTKKVGKYTVKGKNPRKPRKPKA